MKNKTKRKRSFLSCYFSSEVSMSRGKKWPGRGLQKPRHLGFIMLSRSFGVEEETRHTPTVRLSLLKMQVKVLISAVKLWALFLLKAGRTKLLI